jgi:alpha-L-fucosidase 2
MSQSLDATPVTPAVRDASDRAPSRCMLWYDRPAADWHAALPVGNGHLGAMIFGGLVDERVQFNEHTLCSGGSGTGEMGNYEPFGDLHLRFPDTHSEATRYRREVDLQAGVARVAYRVDEVDFRREVIASYPDRVIAIHLTASRPGAIEVDVRLKDAVRLVGAPALSRSIERGLHYAGALPNGMQYCASVRVLHDGGTIRVTDQCVCVEGASTATILLAAATNYRLDPATGWRGESPAPLVQQLIDGATRKGYAEILRGHLYDHESLFDRVQLQVGDDPATDVPTDRRLSEYKAGKADPGLEVTLFQYARYLLIASSRPGTLPANLQGVWNELPKPPWYSQYTTDINVEMNYWLAETTNLAECAVPLLDWIESLPTAQKLNPDPKLRTERGWIIYSTNNALGGNSGWAMHVPGSAWLLQHFWESYAFSEDRAFLEQRAYPMLKELAEMWDTRLVNIGQTLVSPDGWSPEHGPVVEGGRVVIREAERSPRVGVSYDQQIVWDLFTNFIEASAALGVDADLRAHVTARREALLGPRVGRWGQLQEWMEDVDDPKNRHRHHSHLFAVHPGRQITPNETPDLAAAARTSLDARGDLSTGWSVAWKLCIWARLQDGERAGKLMRLLIAHTLHDNLFNSHPPFQIDGNFGYGAGVAEMLVQSHTKDAEGGWLIHLLPALPRAWSSGRVRGLRARGGFTVDVVWKDGQVTSFAIRSEQPRRVTVRVGNRMDVVTSKGI